MTNWSPLWTEEMREEAKRRFVDDLESAGHIAETLGAPSRSAVMGLVWRAGIRRGSTPTNLRRPYTPRKGGDNSGIPRTPSPPKPPPPAPPDDGVSLMQLTRNACRWPITDPGSGRMDQALFCGAQVEPGCTYCALHRAIAYTSSSGRHMRPNPDSNTRPRLRNV